MEEKELVRKRAKNAVISRDFSLALKLYNGLLKDDKENLEYLNAIGSIYEKTNQNEKALEYYARILKQSPVDFEALNHIGGIYRRLKKYDKAIDVLKKALATGKNNAEANYNLGFTYKLTGETQKAIECFESVIDENPGDVLAYNHLGSIYYDNKEYNKSILTYKMGLQIDSNHPILQYNLAKSYEAIKDDSNAISAYETALRAKPLWIDAVKDYARLLLKLYKTKNALEIVRKTLDLHGNQEDLTLLMAKIYFIQTNYEEAKKILIKFLDSNDENYLAHQELAETYEEEGNYSAAESEILKAEKLVPEDKAQETKKLVIKILISAGKLQEAEQRLSLFSANKNHASLIDLEGQIAIFKNSTEKLEDIRKQIVNTKPNYYIFYTNWGRRFIQKGNYSEAKKYLKKHIEKNRKSLLTWLYLAFADEKLEYFESAIEDYKMILSLDSSNYLAKIKLESLMLKNQGFENKIPEEDDDSLPEILPENENPVSESLSQENSEENGDEENLEEKESAGEEITSQDDDSYDGAELKEISEQEDANILQIDDSVTPSEEDFNFDEDELSLQQSLLEGEELSDFGYEMPYEEETEETEEEDEDKDVFINIPDSFPEDNFSDNKTNDFDNRNDNNGSAENPYYQEEKKNEPYTPPYQNPVPNYAAPQIFTGISNGRLSPEESMRLNESLVQSQMNAEKAAEAAEKAWNAAQKAADSAYAIDKAEDFINKMTEDAAKKLQDTAENLQNQIGAKENEEKTDDIQEEFIPEQKNIGENAFSDEESNISGAENLSTIEEKTQNYQKLLSQVTQILPLVENMLNNKEDAEKFQKEVSLFTQLKNLGDYLPEEQKQTFMTSRMRILLDFLIAKLSGKPGLLKTTESLRKSGIFTEKEEILLKNVGPEYENCTERELMKKVISDMKAMTESLHDKRLAEGLNKLAEEAEIKLR